MYKFISFFYTKGTFQLMGTVFYMGVEYTEGFKHIECVSTCTYKL